ncbi:MAG TPA: riboflavin synthase, partial [Abditibacteriaceae bacterium]
MFTGLVECIGTLKNIEVVGDARRLTVGVPDETYLADVQLGESISVGGICLTVTSFTPRSFDVVAVEETLRRTALGGKQVGSRVNLERALLASARLGGHIVQGHVDGVGTVSASRREGE